MFRALPLILALILLPQVALADSTSSLLQSGGNSLGGPSSSADSGTLQPADNNPLQSTTNDSSGLVAPGTSVLQDPATMDQSLNVIADSAEGGTYDPNQVPSAWAWMLATFITGAVGIAVYLFALRRPRAYPRAENTGELEPVSELPQQSDEEPTVDPEEESEPEPGPESALELATERELRRDHEPDQEVAD